MVNPQVAVAQEAMGTETAIMEVMIAEITRALQIGLPMITIKDKVAPMTTTEKTVTVEGILIPVSLALDTTETTEALTVADQTAAK